jgi:hypothetical protein
MSKSLFKSKHTESVLHCQQKVNRITVSNRTDCCGIAFAEHTLRRMKIVLKEIIQMVMNDNSNILKEILRKETGLNLLTTILSSF